MITDLIMRFTFTAMLLGMAYFLFNALTFNGLI